MLQDPHLVPLANLPGVRARMSDDFAATLARNGDCRRALRAKWGKADEVRKLSSGACAMLWRIKHAGRIYVVCWHPNDGASYAVQDARGALAASRDDRLARDALGFLDVLDKAIAKHAPEAMLA